MNWKNRWMGAVAAAAIAAAMFGGTAQARPQRATGGAKYVFFFLGDGMSSSQIQITEAYITVQNGGSAKNPADLMRPENRLEMSKLPVVGIQTTFDDGALMTDSASAGTAFACGVKTGSGIIGRSRDFTRDFKSVAQLAREQGKWVGILSSVPLNHATPASYYASTNSRNNYNEIGVQMADTGYEFFGGGGILNSAAPVNVFARLAANGYTVKNNRADILALKAAPQQKVVCINPTLDGSQAMPYEIDRPAANVSLEEMTEVAIECLKGAPNGFFIMVEGGKIDWACHANDAKAAIGDMIDFDNAVAVALEFYRQFPNDTLIIVTGDHETGGMSVGHATTAYTEYIDRLTPQTKSYEAFQANEWAAHKTAYAAGYDWTKNNLGSADADAVAFKSLLVSVFGMNYDDLNTDQKIKLEDAYDKSMSGNNDNTADENKLLYGGYEPVVVTITHILNERASVGWTSYSHTGQPVPLFAIGFEAHRFAGFYDNTDIAKRIAQVLRIPQTLPVLK